MNNYRKSEKVFSTSTGEKYHEDFDLHYHLKRWVYLGGLPRKDMMEMGKKINNQNEAIVEFIKKGEKLAANGSFKQAGACFRGASFFLRADDPRKKEAVRKAVEYFDTGTQKELVAHGIVRENITVNYKEKSIQIPVYRSETIDPSKETILLHGGFDSTLEDLLSMTIDASRRGYQIISFDGPGQGGVLQNGITMDHDWESIVTPLVDYFELSDVVLVGISMGGYLAARAAAYEKRIKKVVIWGAMYDFQDVLLSKQPLALKYLTKFLLKIKAFPILYGIVWLLSRINPLVSWGVAHGQKVLGASSPYQLLVKAGSFNISSSVKNIKQPVLILMGRNDHLVPFYQLDKVVRGLKNAQTVTAKIYNPASFGEDHCQIGNFNLTMDDIFKWLNN